jgi:hypothetical protein
MMAEEDQTDSVPDGDRVTVDPTQADEEVVPPASGQAEDKGKPSDQDGSTVPGKVPKLRYF